MQTNGKALFLTAILSGATIAHADNAVVNAPPSPAMPNPQNRSVPRIDYLGNDFFFGAGKATRQESAFRDESPVARGPVAMPNSIPSTGLHWVPGNQHPALELRLSDQGTIRFHPTRHGGSISAVWSF
jgi:hypothetical protein